MPAASRSRAALAELPAVASGLVPTGTERDGSTVGQHPCLFGRAPGSLDARRPPRHTALAALPAVALDLETTGLDVANDRIVRIGAVAMRGPTVLGEPRIDTLVDPGTPIPAASTRIHRITGSDVAGSPRLPERLWSRWTLVGHSTHRTGGAAGTLRQDGSSLEVVPRRGLEPPRGCPHMDLNHARLPIPPPRRSRRREPQPQDITGPRLNDARGPYSPPRSLVNEPPISVPRKGSQRPYTHREPA